MTAHIAVVDGVTEIDAILWNQYGDTFSNLFGVTDTNPVHLGRLPLPYRSSDPTSPSLGELWMRSDLGGQQGQLSFRTPQSRNVRIHPTTQVSLSQVSGATININSTSLTNFGPAITITPEGGLYKISLMGGAFNGGYAAILGGATDSFATIGVSWTGSFFSGTEFGSAVVSASFWVPLSSFNWLVPQFAVGTPVTFQLQAKVAHAGSNLAIANFYLLIEEIGIT